MQVDRDAAIGDDDAGDQPAYQDSPLMWIKLIHVGGFFYVRDHGSSIDCERGRDDEDPLELLAAGVDPCELRCERCGGGGAGGGDEVDDILLLLLQLGELGENRGEIILGVGSIAGARCVRNFYGAGDDMLVTRKLGDVGEDCCIELFHADPSHITVRALVVFLDFAGAVMAAALQDHVATAAAADHKTGEEVFLLCEGPTAGMTILGGAQLHTAEDIVGDDPRDRVRDPDNLILRFDGMAVPAPVTAGRGGLVPGIYSTVFFVFEQIMQAVFAESLTGPGAAAVRIQPAEDLSIAGAFCVQLEDRADGVGLLGDELIAALGIDAVSVGRDTAHVAGLGAGDVLADHADALGGVLPLVLRYAGKDIEGEAAGGCAGINVLRGGDQVDLVGGEDVLDDLQRIAEGAGETIQAPDDHEIHSAGTAIGEEALEGRAAHVLCAVAIIGIYDGISAALYRCPGTEDLLLRRDREAFTRLLLGADAEVQGGGH